MREIEGEGGGDVRALPRLGLGPTDGSSFEDSWMTGSFLEGRRRCTGRQGPHGERRPRENVVTVFVKLLVYQCQLVYCQTEQWRVTDVN